MFVLIWVTLFFSVRGSNAETGSFPGGNKICHPTLTSYCITLSKDKITAEAGLCVVIPCSFTAASSFNVQRVIWCKTDPADKPCTESDQSIFNSDETKEVQSKFKGRVSLLEPDVTQKNCSIIIKDLTKSDSGSYQFRIASTTDGFSFSQKVTVSVKGLTKKPTVMIPPLTEGQQTTLTCTAPDLCSGSDPKITWTWRGAGEKDSHITGNITDIKTENVTAVTQRHSSTLTFNPSAEHHGTKVTCKVRFTGYTTTEETVTLNVTYVKEVKITGNTSVKEGETLNLTCSVKSFPPSHIKWTKASDKNMQNGAESNLQEERGVSTFSISNVTAQDSGQYICTAKHQNNTLVNKVNVTVTHQHGPSAVLPWVVAVVSLIVSVICIICVIFLWNTRKKVKPNQEDRTYMSLQKTDPSPEYDVISSHMK